MIGKIGKAFDKLLSFLGLASTVTLILLAGFIFVNFFCRYVLSVNIIGLFSLAVYSLIIFPFLSVAYTEREGKHIVVDVLTSRLPSRPKALLEIGVLFVSLLFPTILGWKAMEWALRCFRLKIWTVFELSLPQGMLILVIVFGCFLLVLQIIRMLIHNIVDLSKSTESRGSLFTLLKGNPWLPLFLFFVGILASAILLVYETPIIGLLCLLLVLFFSGVSVFLSLGLVGCVGLYYLVGPSALKQVPITAYDSLRNFPLTCLPLFILGGFLMEKSGMIDDVFKFFELFSGRYSPGLLIVTIAVGLVVCATTGSSVGATAVLASIILPVLIERGYNINLSAGVVAGATVGSLIPPSLGAVIYGVMVDESIARLFMAQLLPGLVLFGLYFLYIIVLGAVNEKGLFEKGRRPKEALVEQVTWKQKLIAFKKAFWGLFTPIVMLGGIYWGLFTPTEAAAVLVVYVIVVSVFITKGLRWEDIVSISRKSVGTTSMLLCIIMSAYIFGLIILQIRLAPAIVSFAEASGWGQLYVLMCLFVTLVVGGMFLDSASLMLITLPVFYPLCVSVGIDSLWLRVFYCIMLEIGLLTPPVGLNLFSIHGVTGVPLANIIRGVVPFLAMMVLTIVVMYFFPELATWLPSTMGD
jgi:tripartite ATP-independent transporter DctM subunit